MRHRHKLQIQRGLVECRTNAHKTRRIAFIPGNWDTEAKTAELLEFVEGCAKGSPAKWAFKLRKTDKGVRVIARYGS